MDTHTNKDKEKKVETRVHTHTQQESLRCMHILLIATRSCYVHNEIVIINIKNDLTQAFWAF